jgi:hypothetical protein
METINENIGPAATSKNGGYIVPPAFFTPNEQRVMVPEKKTWYERTINALGLLVLCLFIYCFGWVSCEYMHTLEENKRIIPTIEKHTKQLRRLNLVVMGTEEPK